MNATETPTMDPSSAVTTNQRLVTVLLVLLIILLILLIAGIIVMSLVMWGGMTNHMMGMNGQSMNAMFSACSNMMQNFQKP